jgi:hypothetical protein
MVDLTKREHSDPDERKVILFEFVAASSLFLIVALILYMAFTYRSG